MSAEQTADLAAIRAGDISRRRLVLAHRWRDHRTFSLLYRETLNELELRWQDQLLAVGTKADIAGYSGLLASAGIVPRLRFLRAAIWRAQHAAELKRRRKLPTWDQVRQRVYRESSRLLQL
jgi:hypothetical protein